MTSAYDIADYIAGTGFHFTGETQLHKLLYYIQAWSLTWDGAPVFDEEIEAWKNGPVVRSMRHVAPHSLDGHHHGEIPAAQRATIDAILAHYGNHGGAYLSCVTHGEAPWRDARKGLEAEDQSARPISRTSMMREYSTQAMKGEGPRRRRVDPETHDRADVLRRGARIARQWSHTMDRLSR